MGYLRALRPWGAVWASVFILGCGIRAGAPSGQIILMMLVTGLITAAIMANNDYVDRYHDIKKSKPFAAEREESFWLFVVILWAIILAMIFVLAEYLTRSGLVVSLALIIIGLSYSYARHIPFGSMFIVAIAAALPSFIFPLGKIGIIAFASIFFTIMVRELCKDAEDATIDVGYKKTFWTITNIVPSSKVAVMGRLLANIPLIGIIAFIIWGPQI